MLLPLLLGEILHPFKTLRTDIFEMTENYPLAYQEKVMEVCIESLLPLSPVQIEAFSVTDMKKRAIKKDLRGVLFLAGT